MTDRAGAEPDPGADGPAAGGQPSPPQSEPSSGPSPGPPSGRSPEPAGGAEQGRGAEEATTASGPEPPQGPADRPVEPPPGFPPQPPVAARPSTTPQGPPSGVEVPAGGHPAGPAPWGYPGAAQVPAGPHQPYQQGPSPVPPPPASGYLLATPYLPPTMTGHGGGGLASGIGSCVIGLAGCCWWPMAVLPLVMGIVAVVLGYQGLRQVNRSGGEVTGKGVSISAMATGGAGILITVLAVLIGLVVRLSNGGAFG